MIAWSCFQKVALQGRPHGFRVLLHEKINPHTFFGYVVTTVMAHKSLSGARLASADCNLYYDSNCPDHKLGMLSVHLSSFFKRFLTFSSDRVLEHIAAQKQVGVTFLICLDTESPDFILCQSRVLDRIHHDKLQLAILTIHSPEGFKDVLDKYK